MKIARISILLAALVAITFSCQVGLEPTPIFKKSEAAFSVTASTATVALNAADSLDDAISLTWTDPKYSVGLSQTKFSILLGPAGGDFLTFQSKNFNGVLTGALLGKEINGMALKLGGLIGEPIALDAVVVAAQENNNEPKHSNVLEIMVTPYGDLSLTPSATTVVCSASTPNATGISFTWSQAFVGFSGVKTYQFQYAEEGTDFASATSVDVTGSTKSYTQFELNKVALANGVAALSNGIVEFRIKATNELGTVSYSNVASIDITTYVAYNSIGIIGDATAGGWSNDVDLYRPDATKPTEWTGIVKLTGGAAAKFRADDAWAANWGANAFPSGTGTQDGSNIPVNNPGYYKVDFNVASGAYTFTSLVTPVYTFISLIGAQTGWGSDIADLTIDPNNDQVWTGIVALDAGQLKFRANHDWGTNWGITSGTTAANPSGYGQLNGDNMVITTAGTYFVYINVATKEYFFGKSDRNVAITDIGLVGPAQTGGWSDDTNLIRNPANPYKWSANLSLFAGEAKFRADNAWVFDWGSASFPNGVGTQGGSNIPVSADGVYTISFNSSTGEYTFIK